MPAGDICALLLSRPLSLSLYYLCRSLLLSHSTLRSNKKGPRAWALIAASRCCSADRQERGRKEGEEEDRRRQKERRWDGVWERGKRAKGKERASRRERECFVSAAARLTETTENRTECALCAFVCVYVCVFPYTLCVLQLVHSVHAAIRVHELLNTFAWLYVKKRSNGRWRALFW